MNDVLRTLVLLIITSLAAPWIFSPVKSGVGLSIFDGSLIVILESKSGKYSFDAEVELERLFTAAEPNK